MALMEDMASQESQQKIEWLYIFPALNIREVGFIEEENLLNFGWRRMWNACIQISFTFTTLLFSLFSYCVSVAIYCPIYFLFSWFLRALWIFNYLELSRMSLKGLKKTFRTTGVWWYTEWCQVLHRKYIWGNLNMSALLFICIKTSQLINTLLQML